MIEKLNVKDKRLLYELDKNSRQSYRRLAKKIRLSKNAVRYKMQVLQERGIIKQFHTVVDTGKLGYITFRLYINLHDTTPEKEEEIINFLKNKDIVTWLASHGR